MKQITARHSLTDGFLSAGLPVADLSLSTEHNTLKLIATGTDGVSVQRWTLDVAGDLSVDNSAVNIGATHQISLENDIYQVSDFDLSALGADGAKARLVLQHGSGRVVEVEAIKVDQTVFINDPRPGSANIIRLDVGETTLTIGQVYSVNAPVSDLAFIENDGGKFLISASHADDGINTFAIDGARNITPLASAPAGIGISQPGAVATVSVDGRDFIIVGGRQSNSLSVFEMDPRGALHLTDHILDGRDTRFSQTTEIRVISHEGQAVILAAGVDDGTTALTIAPGGRFVMLDTIEDTEQLGLDNISDVEVLLQDGQAHIFASSAKAGEAITHLVFDVSGFGQAPENDNINIAHDANDTLHGHGGDDILIDGLGEDHLTGGAGADTFVLVADGQTDTIHDFEKGVDRLDLSDWSMLYSFDAIQQTQTETGAILQFRGETLVIRSFDGQPLDLSDLPASHIIGLDRPARGVFTPSELLMGDNTAETLVGQADANRIFGRGGDDLIVGGIGADVLDGGLGRDHVDYSDTQTGITIDLSGNTEGDGGALGDVLYNVEDATGSAFDDRINGNSDNNTLKGGAAADVLFGQDGDDVLLGETGDDILHGGNGNDNLHGGSAVDELYGDDGQDVLRGGTGADRLYGGRDDDVLFGNTGVDVLDGGDGDDQVRGGDGVDHLFGGQGNDYLIGHRGWDILHGGDGRDELRGSSGRDLLHGEAGDDQLHGGTGVDDLFGGDGNDTLWGNQGADLLEGGAGDDHLNGGSAVDTLRGDDGNDTLYGNEGADVLQGGADSDALYGGTGEDQLFGGAGDDRLLGNEGSDVLNGGAGNDVLRGGTNGDVFVFDVAHGHDIIEDFDPTMDTLRIDSQILETYMTQTQLMSDHVVIDGNDLLLRFDDLNSVQFDGLAHVDLGDLTALVTFF